ncbi:Uncharacterised protein [Rothia kristinae]|nr:Uncharacterised protein [Rothia kristinae]
MVTISCTLPQQVQDPETSSRPAATNPEIRSGSSAASISSWAPVERQVIRYTLLSIEETLIHRIVTSDRSSFSVASAIMRTILGPRGPAPATRA